MAQSKKAKALAAAARTRRGSRNFMARKQGAAGCGRASLAEPEGHVDAAIMPPFPGA